jgi:hypothetical protein
MHDGGWPGFKAILIGNEKGQGAVILTNSDNGDALYPEIVRRIAEVYEWPAGQTLELCRPKVNPAETSPGPILLADWTDQAKGVGGRYVFIQKQKGKDPIEHNVIIHFDVEKRQVFADIDGGESKGGETLKLIPLGDKVACYPSHPPGPYYDMCRFTSEGEKMYLHLFGAKHTRV